MIAETLKAMLLAGKDAVRTTCGLPVISENISQIRQGSLTFPSMAELELAGGSLQMVHLGCDALLCGHLAELVHGDSGDSGIDAVADQVLNNLLRQLPGRQLQGHVTRLDVGPQTMHTRGVRTFGFRLGTEVGQLYMMAEIPSRIELEIAKDSSFQELALNTYLPGDWSSKSALTTSTVIENFLVYLRKTESDLQIDVPQGDETSLVHTGFVVESVNCDGQVALKVALDLAGAGGAEVVKGTKLHCHVGVGGRSLAFDCEYLGQTHHTVVGDAKLCCQLISAPQQVVIVQRRRAFRIQVPSRIPVEIQCADENSNDLPFQGPIGAGVVQGRLIDLSFSGARIAGDTQQLHGTFAEGARVRCRIHFPGEAEPMSLLGVIRRSTMTLAAEDDWRGDLGIEFLITPDTDRAAMDFLRQYVLAEQREWLAQRIHVNGVGQW